MKGVEYVRHSITGCVNCNTDCKNGDKYEAKEESPRHCINRRFPGDKELYEYIKTQH